MSKKPTGGQAFPTTHEGAQGLVLDGGMTLRDYFAAKALQGLMASRNPNTPHFNPEDDAAYVYAVSGAMLRAREE